MRRGVSVRAYEAAEEEPANGRGGKKRVSFPPKMGRKKRKEGEFRKKVHKFSFGLSLCSKIEIFFSQKIRTFESKFLLLRLIKHNFPFIPPHCGVHIAQSRGTFPDPPAQTLFDLLNHRDFALSLPIGIALKDAVPPNQEIFARLRHAPWGLYGLGFVGKEGGAKACFSSTRKGARAFFGQRALGKPIRFFSCPHAANPTIIVRSFEGFLFEKESPKSYSKGLRGRFFYRFEVYRTAIFREWKIK